MRLARWTCTLLLLACLAANGYRIIYRQYHVWLPGYVRWLLESRPQPPSPVHVFFLYADHFEPGNNYAMVRRWESEYPAMAERHRDSNGRPVQHTWFFPGDQPDDRHMDALRRLVERGYGEVELHYHHGPDTETSARRKFQQAVDYFQRWGFLKTIDGLTRFAFVHGNWSLDNCGDPRYCGVNRELILLRELGCFADFTFPAIWNAAQPPMVNSIFMATDDASAKSYDRGEPARAGVPLNGDLLIFQGPLLIAPSPDLRRLFWQVEDGNIHPAVPLTTARVDLWIRAGIHVKGRPEWLFVKVHGHGATSDQDAEESLGPRFDRALSYLESRYNDGVRYVLHYVTAREAYNLVRAAVEGRTGDPARYYDYVVKPYLAAPASRPSGAAPVVRQDHETGHPPGTSTDHRR